VKPELQTKEICNTAVKQNRNMRYNLWNPNFDKHYLLVFFFIIILIIIHLKYYFIFLCR
jgi:hypothetical protein